MLTMFMAFAPLTFVSPALLALHLSIYSSRDRYAVLRSPDLFQVSQTAFMSSAASVVYMIASRDDVSSPEQYQVGQRGRIILDRPTARQFDRPGVTIWLASPRGDVTVSLPIRRVIREESSQSLIDIGQRELC